jgi:hypothetical protein
MKTYEVTLLSSYPLVTRQHLSVYVPAETNTHAIVEDLYN